LPNLNQTYCIRYADPQGYGPTLDVGLASAGHSSREVPCPSLAGQILNTRVNFWASIETTALRFATWPVVAPAQSAAARRLQSGRRPSCRRRGVPANRRDALAILIVKKGGEGHV